MAALVASRGEEEKARSSEKEPADEATAARLRIAVARLGRRLRPTTAAGTFTTTEVDVLVAAERRGPVRLSDLASFSGLNPTMLSRVVPRLESAGLVRRLDDPADRRVCRVETTQKGRRLLDRIRSERTDVLSRSIRSLSENDQALLTSALPVLERLAEKLLDRDLVSTGSRR